MSDKIKLYILIPLVIIIWGYAIFALIDITSSKQLNNNSLANFELPENIDLTQESYTLILDYKDPFIRNLPTKPANDPIQSPEDKKEEVETEKPEKIVPWPNLIYSGTIKNKNSNNEVAILNIDRNDVLLRKGDTFKDLQLIEVTSDSILVRFNKEEKYFLK